MGNHGCLAFVAYSLLHVTCLPAGSDRMQGLSIDHVFAWLFGKSGVWLPRHQ
jgi:hypothetical protein